MPGDCQTEILSDNPVLQTQESVQDRNTAGSEINNSNVQRLCCWLSGMDKGSAQLRFLP